MSRAKSVDVLLPNQQFLPDVCPVNSRSIIDTDLSVNHCSLSSQLHSQTDYSLTSQTSHQQKLLSKHYQSSSEICENEKIISLGVHGRRQSKSHETIIIHKQMPLLPTCNDSQQHSTSHYRSSSFQDFSFTKSSCKSHTQRCPKDDTVFPLVKKQQLNFKISDLLMQCKAESVPNQLHQEELLLPNQSNMVPNRCRFGKSSATLVFVKF